MAASKTQDKGLALLNLFLGQNMEYHKRVYGGQTGIIHLSLPLYHFVSKERFTNVDLNPSYPTVENTLSKHFQGCESWGEDMAATAATAQDLYRQLTIGNQISQAAKMGLRVVIRKGNFRRKLVMACYIVTGIYRDYCLFSVALKTLMDWVEDNQDNLLQSILNSHLATALAHDVFTFLV